MPDRRRHRAVARAAAAAAAARIGDGPRWRVDSPRTVLALVAGGEGYALVPAPAAEPLPPCLTLRPLADAPEWELRAARPASEVPAVGTLAVMDALRRASVAPVGRRWAVAGYARA